MFGFLHDISPLLAKLLHLIEYHIPAVKARTLLHRTPHGPKPLFGPPQRRFRVTNARI
jgi:hypothetical protein